MRWRMQMSDLVGFILLVTAGILYFIRFCMEVRDNHPNNKIHGGKK